MPATALDAMAARSVVARTSLLRLLGVTMALVNGTRRRRPLFARRGRSRTRGRDHLSHRRLSPERREDGGNGLRRQDPLASCDAPPYDATTTRTMGRKHRLCLEEPIHIAPRLPKGAPLSQLGMGRSTTCFCVPFALWRARAANDGEGHCAHCHQLRRISRDGVRSSTCAIQLLLVVDRFAPTMPRPSVGRPVATSRSRNALFIAHLELLFELSDRLTIVHCGGKSD